MDLSEDSDQIEIAIAFEQRALYSPKLVHRKTQDGDYVEVTDAKYETQTDANGNDQTVASNLHQKTLGKTQVSIWIHLLLKDTHVILFSPRYSSAK